MDMKLTGKVALVTGSSRGIGKATAIALAREGAKIAVNYLREHEKAEIVVNEIKNAGCQSFSVSADVSKRDQVRTMIQEVVKTFGCIDILVNNAGCGAAPGGRYLYFDKDSKSASAGTYEAIMAISKKKPGWNYGQISIDDWERMINIHLKGTFNCIQEVTPYMIRSDWGRIINIASFAAHGIRELDHIASHYSAAKAGIIGLTKATALELASHGVTCNAISPGFVITDLMGEMTEKELAELNASIPMGSANLPEDIASMVVYLSSAWACRLTGANVDINAGVIV